jgi:hypothetical protein
MDYVYTIYTDWTKVNNEAKNFDVMAISSVGPYVRAAGVGRGKDFRIALLPVGGWLELLTHHAGGEPQALVALHVFDQQCKTCPSLFTPSGARQRLITERKDF